MREWEKNIRKVEPYVPGEQPKDKDIIKLNTNENPYPPAPHVKEVLESIRTEDFRKYPDPAADMLISAISENYGVDKNMIFTGVGSDDVLSMIFLTFFNSDRPVLFPDITYSFYSVWADVYRIKYETPLLDENFNIRAEDYYGPNGGVVIANPNAPTGIYRNLDFIKDILEHNRDVIVVVDEAYIDFAGQSAVSLLKDYDNLIVVQTFSKSKSLAGMRISMAFANPELIKALNDVKYSVNSYTMNMPSILLGTAAAESMDYYNRTTEKIIETRKRSAGRLKALGFECLESGSNFIFARHGRVKGTDIYDFLRKNKVFVRHFNAPRIDDFLRISIGTDAEMDRLFELLEGYLANL